MENIKELLEEINSANISESADATDKVNAVADGSASDLPVPSHRTVVTIIENALAVLFPGYFGSPLYTGEEVLSALDNELRGEVRRALNYSSSTGDSVGDAAVPDNADDITEAFMKMLPEVKRLILTDLQAIYDGDPAAKSKLEIALAYPGFYAIAVYRLAHVLHSLHVPYIPRMMTEYAHERTGVDINPGATIGEYFCIDHGTGIVIGETAVLGHHVKLYQGVTIGAKSFAKDENGNPVKEGKRHPDIGDYVIIYANATILGGDTRIGDYAVIGGNSWITESIDDGAKLNGVPKPEGYN